MSYPKPDDFPELRPFARQGKAYRAELRAIFKEIQHDLRADFDRLYRARQKFTPRDLCYLALKYRVNPKATYEMLEDLKLVPIGKYDTLRERGFRPMAALYEVWDTERLKFVA